MPTNRRPLNTSFKKRLTPALVWPLAGEQQAGISLVGGCNRGKLHARQREV